MATRKTPKKPSPPPPGGHSPQPRPDPNAYPRFVMVHYGGSSLENQIVQTLLPGDPMLADLPNNTPRADLTLLLAKYWTIVSVTPCSGSSDMVWLVQIAPPGTPPTAVKKPRSK